MIKEIKSAEIVCLTAVNTFCSAHRKLTEFLSRHLYTFVCLIAPRPSPEQHHCVESISSLCNNNYLLPLSSNTALLSSTSAAVFEGKTDQTAISGRSELTSQGLRYIESSTVTFNLRDFFFFANGVLSVYLYILEHTVYTVWHQLHICLTDWLLE